MQYPKLDNVNPKPIIRNNLELYHWTDAIKMIAFLNAKKIPLFGIDGFYLEANSIQPSMENSVDFCGCENFSPEEIYDDALNFLLDRKEKGLVYEIIYEGN